MKILPEIPSSVRELATVLSQPKPMRRGSVSERTMKCGKASCPCQEDPKARHGPYYSLTRPVAGNQVAEMIGAAAIAASIRHDIQPAGGQRREALQRLADERQIRVNLRRTWRRPDPRQPGLRQHSPHHAVVDMQLARDGAHRPFLGVIEAQDLCLDVRRRHHGRVPSGRVVLQPVSAVTAAAQEPLADEWRAATTAPVTVRDRSPGPILRNSCVARTLRRARRQQIIGWRWG